MVGNVCGKDLDDNMVTDDDIAVVGSKLLSNIAYIILVQRKYFAYPNFDSILE